jgi:AraC family transcriptional regulator
MADGYRTQIERAIQFIAANLDRPLTVADVARVAHLSEFHFHRIFSAEVGEPIGRFIVRRRLEVAALRLAYEPDRSVTDIALSCGYSSGSNFSKAFTAFFGCSPSRVRRPDPSLPPAIGKLTTTYGKAFDPMDLHALPPGQDPAARGAQLAELSRGVRFESFAGLDVACLASPEGYDPPAVERTWAELIERSRQLGLCGDDVDAYGMAWDSPYVTSPERCRYHACVPAPAGAALPRPLFRGRIPESRYAVFRYAGAVAGVEQVYRAIYASWLPASSLAPDDFVAVDHYVHDGPVDGAIDCEIWIKVRPRR